MSGMGSGSLALQTELPAGSTAAGEATLRAQVSAVEFALFSPFGIRRKLAADQVLFEQGDVGTSMFIIVSGAISLDFGSGLPPKQLGPNDFFGELGLLIDRHPRSSAARACCDTVLLEITCASFQCLIDQDPATVVFFLRRTLWRVVSSEQRLIGQLSRRNEELEVALRNLYSANHELHHTRELVYNDDLTGMGNRRALTVYLQDAHRSSQHPQGLLLIDCDDFKGLNDSHGHLAGDHMLKSLGRVLSSVAGNSDIACRLGGDEFCVLLQEADSERLTRVAGFILEAVHGLVALPGALPGTCSVSIGLMLMDGHCHWNEAYSRADDALYEAKRLGGGHAQWALTTGPAEQ